MNAEQSRLEAARIKKAHWKKWGPYLSERQWGTVREDYSESGDAAWYTAIHLVDDFKKGTPRFRDPKVERTVWDRVIDIASEYKDSGVFTAFNGYEYSSTVDSNNLHRVVIFKDAADKVGRIIPFSSNDSVDPEDLWKFMAGYEKNTGGFVLALAHNGNLSMGLMFDTKTWPGKQLTKAYAEERTRWEPMYEVTQIKGDGEAHPRGADRLYGE
jgi:hypothetical protein